MHDPIIDRYYIDWHGDSDSSTKKSDLLLAEKAAQEKFEELNNSANDSDETPKNIGLFHD